jgi:tetratricopeptide (TPR) repeat protein
MRYYFQEKQDLARDQAAINQRSRRLGYKGIGKMPYLKHPSALKGRPGRVALGSGFMSRTLLRAVLVSLALVLPLSGAVAAVDPNPFQNREPSFNKKTLDLLNEAQRQIQAGKVDEAIRQLNLAASLEPNNPYILARLGVALNMIGDYQNALDRLRRARRYGGEPEVVLGPMLETMLSMGQNQAVLDLFPDPPADSRTFVAGMVLRARASALQVMGDSAGAAAAMKRSLAILNDYNGVMTAGRIALMQGNYDAAEQFVGTALKLSPNDIDARMLKIDLAMRRRNTADALQMTDRLVTDFPRSVAALLIRIRVYLAADLANKAEPDIDRVLEAAPNMPIARYFKAVVMARHGDPKGAWDIAHVLPKEYLQADPGVALNVASMAIAAGYPDSGASILNVIVQRFPWLLDARLALADLRLRQNSPQYAINVLSLIQDSKDPKVLALYARIALMKRDKLGAQKYIQQVIQSGGGEELRTLDKQVALKSLQDYIAAHPADKLVKKQLAILLLGFGEIPKAKSAYEQLVRDDPSDAVALNNLSWLVVQDDPARALSLAQRAVRAAPTSANNLDTLGTMQLNRSEFKAAVVSLVKAHELTPDNAEFAYHLALALQASGEAGRSRALLQDLVKRGGFSDLDAAKNLLASQLKMAGQIQPGQR